MAIMTGTLVAPRADLTEAYREFFSRKAAFKCPTRYARGLPRALTAR